MASNKKDLAPLKFPKLGPEKMVKEYFYSKAADSVVKKFPEWDVPRMDPAIKVVLKRRQLYETEQKLIKKRDDAKEKRKEMNGQWADLESKEHQLKENFIKFNKFVKENQEKRERAEHKLADEQELTIKRTEDTEELRRSYDSMYDIRLQMESNIRSHRIYEEYLQNVITICPTFRTVHDILDRYETLAEARKELAERQEKDLSTLEEARNEMGKLTEDNALIISGLNNVMAELLTRYEEAKSRAFKWENVVTKIKDTCVKKLQELDDIRKSCWNVYVQMCKRKQIEPEIDQNDIEKQLVFIKTTLLELRRITLTVKKRLTRERERKQPSVKTR